MELIQPPSGLDIYHIGPPLEEGPLPAFFYFALSAKDSLTTRPFCQPVDILKHNRIRCFSFDLPYHGEGHITADAVSAWTNQLRNKNDFFDPFLTKAKENIDFLVTAGYIDPDNIVAGGLSRGGFIASHLAARDPGIKAVVGFSPLTVLTLMQEFRIHGIPPLAERYALIHIIDKLIGRQFRFYIGNRDIRVGTAQCFDFIQQLTEANHKEGFRSPPVELSIFPSIGHRGHGTPPEVFKAGSEWVCALSSNKI